MRTFLSNCSSFDGLLRPIHNAKRCYTERVPEAVRDMLTIVLGLAATACAVLLALALLTWRM